MVNLWVKMNLIISTILTHRGKRWVIYSTAELSRLKIPPEWHLWIHFLTNNKPSDKKIA